MALEELLGIVEEVQGKVKDGCGHGLPVHVHVLLQQVPAARPHKQHRSLQQQARSTSQGYSELPIRHNIMTSCSVLTGALISDRLSQCTLGFSW